MQWSLVGIFTLVFLILFITVPTAFAADSTISDQTSCEANGGIWDGAELSCTVLGVPDYSRPDTSPGVRWVNGIGSPPCADLTPEFCVDEVVRDDSDYIQTIGIGDGGQDIQYFTLSDVPDPNQSTAHFLRYTLREGNVGTNPVGFTIELRQGATIIATFTHAQGTLPQTYQLFSQELTPVQADSITDYTDLELTLTGTCQSGCGNNPSLREKVLVSWIEFKILLPTTVNSGDSLTIAPDDVLKNTGTIENSGTINLDYAILDNTISGIIDNSDTITVVSDSSGEIENAGTINNLSGGTISLPSGFVENSSGGTINNFGTMNQEEISNSGTIDNKAGGIITFDDGSIENYATITNFGTININSGVFTNFGTIDNSGTININSSALNNDSGIIDNKSGGTINFIDSTSENFSTITNTGTINIDATSTINNYGTLDTQSGTITNSGTVENFGTINNNVGGNAINNLGTLNINSGGVITGGSPTGSPSVNNSDTDGDDISDEVDTLPNTFSYDISDLSLGGTTSGTITKRGGHLLTISEAPNPDGVRMIADISGGLTPTTVSACSGASTIDINGGDDVTLTCSSVKLKVHSGQVEMTFFDTNGNSGFVILNEGDELYYKPDEFSLEAISGTIEISLTTSNGSNSKIALHENSVVTFDPEISISLPDGVNVPTTNETIVTTDLGTVVIPAGTSSSSSTINLPTHNLETEIDPTEIPAGKSVLGVVEIGRGDTPVILSQPIRILIPGLAGSTPFFTQLGQITIITAQCPGDSLGRVINFLDPGEECFINVGGDLVIWTRHLTGFGGLVSSGGGDSNAWKTKPTFGISHKTNEQFVDDSFTFNGKSYQINDNFHTDFAKQYFKTGSVNTFSAKAFAPYGVHVMEFDFGIPVLGDAHKAQVMIEVWLNYDLEVEQIIVRQDEKFVDENSIIPEINKSKCQETDVNEECVTVSVSAKFLESTSNDVMAIKAIDFKGRYQITYLNEGFDITGDPLNPPQIDYKPSGRDGLVQMIRFDKFENLWVDQTGIKFDEFDNLWVDPSGIVYTRNELGSWFRLSPYTIENNDPSWNVMTRYHDEFSKLIEYERKRATQIFDGSLLLKELPDYTPSKVFEEDPEQRRQQILQRLDEYNKLQTKQVPNIPAFRNVQPVTTTENNVESEFVFSILDEYDQTYEYGDYFAISGTETGRSNIIQIEIFSPNENRFTELSFLSINKEEFSTLFLPNKDVLVYGNAIEV